MLACLASDRHGSNIESGGQCHLIHLTILRRFSWPSSAYMCRKMTHPRVKVSIVGSLRDREVACSASDRQGSNFESCVWRTVSSQSSHHPQEVLLAQFSLYVHKGGLKPDSFHFISFHFLPCRFTKNTMFLLSHLWDIVVSNLCSSLF